jgi:hypothetical protein
MEGLIPFSGRSRTIQRENQTLSNDNIVVRGKKTDKTILEQEIDLDEKLEEFDHTKLKGIDGKKLYESPGFRPWSKQRNSVFFTDHGCSSSVTGDNTLILDLVSPESQKKLKRSDMKFCHLGMIIIAAKALHRKQAGARTLFTVLDTAWNEPEKAIMGGMEMDMNLSSGLYCLCPDTTKDVRDIEKIKIGVQTKGYEGYKGFNLGIQVKLIARNSTHLQSYYKMRVNNIVEQLVPLGNNMIVPQKIDGSLYNGQEWNLSKFLHNENSGQVPGKMITYKNSSGETSGRFTGYKEQAVHSLDDIAEQEREDYRRNRKEN